MSVIQLPSHLDRNTVASYQAIIRKYDVTSETTWADVRPQVLQVRNNNTRRHHIIALRTILGSKGAMKIPAHQPRIYRLPTEEEIIQGSTGPYQHYILAMAYAGLRIGEAVALERSDVKSNGSSFWIEVTKSKDHTGRIKQPKSSGRVVINEWLYELLVDAEYSPILPNSLYKWMKRRGLQPHGLRHWYATYLVRNVPNVEIARRQLRHANLQTTLQTYVQISAEDEMTAIAGLTSPFR